MYVCVYMHYLYVYVCIPRPPPLISHRLYHFITSVWFNSFYVGIILDSLSVLGTYTHNFKKLNIFRCEIYITYE